jgi:hypothetical protein
MIIYITANYVVRSHLLEDWGDATTWTQSFRGDCRLWRIILQFDNNGDAWQIVDNSL